MITVHHLENSRSQRILWLLEELKLEYTIKRYARDPKTMRAPADLRRIHPLGKSPVVQLEAITLVESGAIMETLVEETGRFGPPESSVEARRYRLFLHYAEGSLMPPLFAMLVVRRLGLLGRPARKPVQHMLDTHFRWLDDELAEREWFCGDSLTIADMMMSFPLEAAQARAGLDDRYPNILAWLERCHARDAYQRALSRGGDYAYA